MLFIFNSAQYRNTEVQHLECQVHWKILCLCVQNYPEKFGSFWVPLALGVRLSCLWWPCYCDSISRFSWKTRAEIIASASGRPFLCLTFYGGVSFLTQGNCVIATIQVLEGQALMAAWCLHQWFSNWLSIRVTLLKVQIPRPHGKLLGCFQALFLDLWLGTTGESLPAQSLLFFPNPCSLSMTVTLSVSPTSHWPLWSRHPSLSTFFCLCSTLGNKWLKGMQFELVIFQGLGLRYEGSRLNSRTSH